METENFKHLYNVLNNEIKRIEPMYDRQADYQTNSKSYYDYLAKLKKLFELLSNRIWEYDDELKKRFDEWDKLIEKFPENVEKLLIEWLNDGVIADVVREAINEEVIEARNDYPSLKDRLNNEQIKVYEEIQSFKDSFKSFDKLFDKNFNGSGLGYDIPFYYKERLNEMANICKTQKFSNAFKAIFLTDAHNQYSEYAPNSIYHPSYASHLTNLTDIDHYVLGGDNGNGWYDKTQVENELIGIVSNAYNLANPDTNVFILNGNHDNGAYQNGKTKPEQVISNRRMKEILKTTELVNGEIRNNDSLYSYIDYPDKEYRVFHIDNFDFNPNVTNENGMIKYDSLNNICYSQEQLRWFADSLFSTPENYEVIIFQHAPLEKTFDNQNNFNGDVYKNIIKAFTTKQSFKISDDLREFPVNISVDFSKRSKGKVACIVNGHLHRDDSMYWEGILLLSVGCSLCFSGDEERVPNTYTEDLWDLILFDNVNKEINCLRFGYGLDRKFNY